MLIFDAYFDLRSNKLWLIWLLGEPGTDNEDDNRKIVQIFLSQIHLLTHIVSDLIFNYKIHK